jgi:hypothetical protein
MCEMYTWRKAKHIHKIQTQLLVREEVTAGVQLKKKSGRGSQGAWRQDELIGGKSPVVK